MNFQERKQQRTRYYFNNVYKHIQVNCSSCGGSGIYDHNGSPPCGACEGTGKSFYHPKGTIVKFRMNNTWGRTKTHRFEFRTESDADIAKKLYKDNIRKLIDGTLYYQVLYSLFSKNNLDFYVL
jgi:DnaJ-class molecular chaperone